jgi:hypothetical protein
MAFFIPSSSDLSRHRKTKRLMRALDLDVVRAVGHLHLFWHWVVEFSPTGDISFDRFTCEDIADGAVWPGDAFAFLEALITSGFVDRQGERLLVHDWDSYGGAYQKRLARDRERKRGKGIPAEAADVPAEFRGIPSEGAWNSTESDGTTRNSGNIEIGIEKEIGTSPRSRAHDEGDSADIPAIESIAELTGEQPFDVLAAFAAEIDSDLATVAPAWKKKQLAVAKRLLEEGYGADKVRRYIRYRLSETWRNGSPFDLFNVEKEIGTWEASGAPARAVARNGIRPSQADINQPRRNPDGTLRAVH